MSMWKSIKIASNRSAMANVASQMSTMSAGFSICSDITSSITVAQSSLADNPFVVGGKAKQQKLLQKNSSAQNARHRTLVSASSLSNQYESLSENNNDMINGTLGSQIAEDDASKSASQQNQALRVQLETDPQFSVSYSASQSASASIASLSPSDKDSVLNSIANAQWSNNRDSFNHGGNANE